MTTPKPTMKSTTRTSLPGIVRRLKIEHAKCGTCKKLAWDCRCRRTAYDLADWICRLGEEMKSRMEWS